MSRGRAPQRLVFATHAHIDHIYCERLSLSIGRQGEIMIKSSSDGIDRSGTSIPLGEYGDGWACTNTCSFRSCDSHEPPLNGYKREIPSWDSKTPRPTLGRFAVKKQRNHTRQRHPRTWVPNGDSSSPGANLCSHQSHQLSGSCVS